MKEKNALFTILIFIAAMFLAAGFSSVAFAAEAVDPTAEMLADLGIPVWTFMAMAALWVLTHVAAWTDNTWDNKLVKAANNLLNLVSGNYGNARNKEE